MRTGLRLITLASAATLQAACASVSAPQRQPATGVQVVIDNREFADMQILVVREGVRIPLGTVGGFQSRSFTINSPVIPADGRVSLIATTRSETQTLESPVVIVQRGQVVSWRIEYASHGKSIIVR
jgi:hypothetical protein